MIIDRCENIGLYRRILPGVDAGLEALRALGETPAVGRYEFDGGYFMIQEGDTKSIPEGEYEAHRKYIDVQIVLRGEETVAWAHLSELTEAGAYDEVKDKQMFAGEPAQCNVIREGMVWIAFPEDGHKACRHLQEQTHYLKAVMKLPIA